MSRPAAHKRKAPTYRKSLELRKTDPTNPMFPVWQRIMDSVGDEAHWRGELGHVEWTDQPAQVLRLAGLVFWKDFADPKVRIPGMEEPQVSTLDSMARVRWEYKPICIKSKPPKLEPVADLASPRKTEKEVTFSRPLSGKSPPVPEKEPGKKRSVLTIREALQPLSYLKAGAVSAEDVDGPDIPAAPSREITRKKAVMLPRSTLTEEEARKYLARKRQSVEKPVVERELPKPPEPPRLAPTKKVFVSAR